MTLKFGERPSLVNKCRESLREQTELPKSPVSQKGLTCYIHGALVSNGGLDLHHLHHLHHHLAAAPQNTNSAD